MACSLRLIPVMSVRTLISVQRDVLSGGGGAFIETALALAGDPESLGSEASGVAKLLREWDGRASSTSVGAAVYHVFLDILLRKVFAPEMGDDLLRRYLALARSNPTQLLHQTQCFCQTLLHSCHFSWIRREP